jgi:hypothetical protein
MAIVRGRKVLIILTMVVALSVCFVVVLCAGFIVGARAVVSRLDPFEARPFDPVSWGAADDEGRATSDRGRHRRRMSHAR